jgi:cytosine/adenosine deaminase-related metal-dependent hydrolase
MDRSTQRIQAGVAVLSASSLVRSVCVELEGGKVIGWEAVPERSLSEEERATVLTPGLINAHAHLDLGALRGAVSGSGGFLAWVAALVAAREELGENPPGRDRLMAGVRASAHEALRTGTTSVLDIDSMGLTTGALSAGAPRVFTHREVLDGSPQGRSPRTESALQTARAAIERGRGLSPHATHTVGAALLKDLGALTRSHAESNDGQRVPLAIHWAETPEETQWLLRGEGPFAGWLGPSSGRTGTERLAAAGLLRGALLIHGNDPQPGEPERLAEADGTLVHCPGCHLYFGRPRFPLERYESAGVRLALGTDSWASNESLDMRREMRLARETLGLDAAATWRMATENGALSVPDQAVTGRIEEGSAADLVAFEWPRTEASADLGAIEASALDRLTRSSLKIRQVWVGGEPSAPDRGVR